MTQTEIYTAVDAVVAIWHRKILVVLIFLAALASVALITVTSEKSYLSDAKIFVRLGRENSALDATAGLGDRGVYALPFNRESEINSIAEMLNSKELFGQVVDQVGAQRILKKSSNRTTSEDSADSLATEAKTSWLGSVLSYLASVGILNDLEPRERAIIQLQKNTKILPGKQSYTVSVIHEGHGPALSQEIVSTLIDAYLKQYAQTHRLDRGNDFLAQQTELAEEQLRDSEKDFEDFKNRTRMMSIQDQRTIYVNRIAKLENEILENDAFLYSIEAELKALQLILKTVPKSESISQTAGAGNDAIDGMRQELFRLQVQREDLLARYQPSSPLVQRVEEQLKAAQEIFQKTESQLIEKVEGPSRVYEGAKLQLIEKEPRLDAHRSRKVKLENQLAKVLDEMSFFNDNETEFIRLQRQFELCDENYKRLKRGLQQANIELAMQERNLSNLTVFQPASFNPKPHRPNKLINGAIGIALGMIMGCAVAVLLDFRQKFIKKQSATNFHDSLLNLDLLVLAEVPRQSSRSLLQPEQVEIKL